MYKHGINGLDIATVHESAFIHTNWGPNYVSHPTWADWFHKVGIDRRIDPSRGRRVGLSGLAISSARMGLGIALGQKEMARRDLEAGKLIQTDMSGGLPEVQLQFSRGRQCLIGAFAIKTKMGVSRFRDGK